MRFFEAPSRHSRPCSGAVALSEQREFSELEALGLIQGFEFTHELAWNVLKDYLEAQGFVGLIGSKNASREAFKNGLIADGEAWMGMIKARNLTSHTYNTELAESIVQDILQHFYPAFSAMAETFTELSKQADKRVEVRVLGQERIIVPAESSWDSFFRAGGGVTEDFMTERASQFQSERESF